MWPLGRYESSGSSGGHYSIPPQYVQAWTTRMTTQFAGFPRLKRNEQRGSKPRCHLVTQGSAQEVAAKLTSLCAPFASVSPSDTWMPRGFDELRECQLHRRSVVLDNDLCDALAAWWLPPDQRRGRTPNFDIAATCSVSGRPGVLLVEAKAHDTELTRESAGRKRVSTSSKEDQAQRDASHKTIGAAIELARVGLEAQTGLKFGISRDVCYQMSNRFAWAWKLADAGVPVVLVYLGFLNADDMASDGNPLRNHEQWEKLVLAHGAPIVPEAIWNRRWTVKGQTLAPIIRSISQPLSGL